MDPNTGMLRIRLPLDRETRDKYILSVEARNGGSTGYCQVSNFSLFVMGYLSIIRLIEIIFVVLYLFIRYFNVQNRLICSLGGSISGRC